MLGFHDHYRQAATYSRRNSPGPTWSFHQRGIAVVTSGQPGNRPHLQHDWSLASAGNLEKEGSLGAAQRTERRSHQRRVRSVVPLAQPARAGGSGCRTSRRIRAGVPAQRRPHNTVPLPSTLRVLPGRRAGVDVHPPVGVVPPARGLEGSLICQSSVWCPARARAQRAVSGPGPGTTAPPPRLPRLLTR